LEAFFSGARKAEADQRSGGNTPAGDVPVRMRTPDCGLSMMLAAPRQRCKLGGIWSVLMKVSYIPEQITEWIIHQLTQVAFNGYTYEKSA
jgi:hypothetical protein